MPAFAAADNAVHAAVPHLVSPRLVSWHSLAVSLRRPAAVGPYSSGERWSFVSAWPGIGITRTVSDGAPMRWEERSQGGFPEWVAVPRG